MAFQSNNKRFGFRKHLGVRGAERACRHPFNGPGKVLAHAFFRLKDAPILTRMKSLQKRRRAGPIYCGLPPMSLAMRLALNIQMCAALLCTRITLDTYLT